MPGDYLMTAPNYAAQRSELAKSIGLGRKAAAPGACKTESKSVRSSNVAALSATQSRSCAKFPRWRWNKWSGSHCPG
ncbi:hypothetical protein MES4922_140063 [Mesorhizobium ventifaucium]|uniref:Uncharacterized protein n=1 Tax=Mesorhizobium ventifaucium TaxID=666020 RepID=A0ABM9DH91_9HYPH|nr:hypothetical protein MES4922_140063 [Mesorhizobium ventifaucium]